MKLSAPPIFVLLPLVTVVGAAVTGAMIGTEIALLVVAGGALVGVIALLWASVQSLTGESPLTLDEALSLGAPSAEEEQKRAVLRALKDLEFERGVGKISEEDYAELSARYRAEARRLIAALDAGGAVERAEVERQLAERLKEAKKKAIDRRPPAEPDAEAAADGVDAPAESSPSSPLAAGDEESA